MTVRKATNQLDALATRRGSGVDYSLGYGKGGLDNAFVLTHGLVWQLGRFPVSMIIPGQ
jgi:hypothetical protein